MLFYVKEMALLYHRLKGGVVITNNGEGIESLMPPVEKLLATIKRFCRTVKWQSR